MTFFYLLIDLETFNNSLSFIESKRPQIVKQLTCLAMQIEVTKVITSNSSCAGYKFTRVPTLLGTESEKCEVICLLFESQKDFKAAFNFTEE